MQIRGGDIDVFVSVIRFLDEIARCADVRFDAESAETCAVSCLNAVMQHAAADFASDAV